MSDEQRQIGPGERRPKAVLTYQLWLPADHLILPLGKEMVGFYFGQQEIELIRAEIDAILSGWL